MRLALVVVAAGCAARPLPPNNAARPIQVELRLDGWRAEEARDRLERLLVRDPAIGVGPRIIVKTWVERRVCAVSFQIKGEGVTIAYWVHGRSATRTTSTSAFASSCPAPRMSSPRASVFRYTGRCTACRGDVAHAE